MKRLLAAFAMVSMLVFSQASPALGLTYVYISPASQTTRMGNATYWNVVYNSSGYASWWIDYGDGSYRAGTAAGSVNIRVSHTFMCQNRTYTQVLTVQDYATGQTKVARSTTVVYGYCL